MPPEVYHLFLYTWNDLVKVRTYAKDGSMIAGEIPGIGALDFALDRLDHPKQWSTLVYKIAYFQRLADGGGLTLIREVFNPCFKGVSSG